jgi:hypothetical protein
MPAVNEFRQIGQTQHNATDPPFAQRMLNAQMRSHHVFG